MRRIILILIFVALCNLVYAADPTFVDIPTDGATLNEDELYYFDINASDAEDGNDSAGTNLTFTDDTDLFNINETTGIFSFTPTADDVGVYNATFFLSWGIAGTIISGPLIDFLLNTGFKDVISYQVAFFVGAVITGMGLAIFLILEIWFKPKSVNN